MSLAGKTSIGKKLRSLFHREQAPSSTRTRSRAVILSEEELEEMDPKVRKWLEEKCYRFPDKTIDITAKRLGTTSAKLLYYCKARCGIDFRSWRSRLRIEDAKKQLLEEPETSVATIARRVGYLDRSNFTRHFRELTGNTPARWRELFG